MEIHPTALRGNADKGSIKLSVMGNQNRVSPTKIIKRSDCFPFQRRIPDHVVGNPGQLRYLCRNRYLRIDKGIKAV
ncbi:hypothetical protein SDC9_204172 [bioreactor metagenome]|uniref:Uncharacterized protein n=1 Tax=bioreactor metagenome TaxID=1076179 RepID=A0A645J044_9ZZZZ